MKPFDLKAALEGNKLVTRDRKRTVSNFKNRDTHSDEFLFSAFVDGLGMLDGKYAMGRDSMFDLFMADNQHTETTQPTIDMEFIDRATLAMTNQLLNPDECYSEAFKLWQARNKFMEDNGLNKK